MKIVLVGLLLVVGGALSPQTPMMWDRVVFGTSNCITCHG